MRHIIVRAFVLATLAIGIALTPTTARAGCVVEYNDCEACARQVLREAILDFDLGGIRQAHLQVIDCGIDLWHCVMLGKHHEYPCAR